MFTLRLFLTRSKLLILSIKLAFMVVAYGMGKPKGFDALGKPSYVQLEMRYVLESGRECYLGVKVELCKNMYCQSIRIVITTSSYLAT